MNYNNVPQNNGKANGLSIAGFCVSMGGLLLSFWGITSIVGIVLSAVGRSKAIREGAPTGLATAGIVVGICTLVISLIISIACVACVSTAPYYY